MSRDSAGELWQHETMRAGGRRSTGLRLRSLAAVALIAVAPVATAQTAITTLAVKMRAGPSTDFPSVTTLMGGTSATVIGCESSWRWCDVSAGRDRGWVSSRYLSTTYKGNKVTILAGGPTLELPVTEFSLAAYWGEHYRGRVFFGRQAFYQNRWDRRAPAPEWRAPRTAATTAPRPAP